MRLDAQVGIPWHIKKLRHCQMHDSDATRNTCRAVLLRCFDCAKWLKFAFYLVKFYYSQVKTKVKINVKTLIKQGFAGFYSQCTRLKTKPCTWLNRAHDSSRETHAQATGTRHNAAPAGLTPRPDHRKIRPLPKTARRAGIPQAETPTNAQRTRLSFACRHTRMPTTRESPQNARISHQIIKRNWMKCASNSGQSTDNIRDNFHRENNLRRLKYQF